MYILEELMQSVEQEFIHVSVNGETLTLGNLPSSLSVKIIVWISDFKIIFMVYNVFWIISISLLFTWS